jgi:hypothetical protein
MVLAIQKHDKIIDELKKITKLKVLHNEKCAKIMEWSKF